MSSVLTKNLIDRSTLGMYRDIRKMARHMSVGNASKLSTLDKMFWLQFEQQRKTTKEEHDKFREGIVKILSNYMLHVVKEEYLGNKEKYDDGRVKD